jgi:diacylglycerol kinase (ATP)
MKKEWFFILNATAGNGKSGKLISQIITTLNQKKIPYEMELTKAPGHATQLAQSAVAKGYEKIISVGGDGTLNEVVKGIMSSPKVANIKLGILPEGGGNDYAKNFHMPHQVSACIDVFLRDKTKKVDVGKAGEHFFINSFGLGFDARVANFSQRIKGLNGLPRYLLAVIKAMIKLETYPLEIRVNEEMLKVNALFIAINNGKFSGGGFKLTPDAITNDGKLDICIASALTRMEILRNLPKAIQGKHTHLAFVQMKLTEKVEIFSEIPIPWYYDGEIPHPKTIKKVTVSLLPESLSLLIP